ncbi:hypothetical protein DICA2_D08438 [Diutina catenulata]
METLRYVLGEVMKIDRYVSQGSILALAVASAASAVFRATVFGDGPFRKYRADPATTASYAFTRGIINMDPSAVYKTQSPTALTAIESFYANNTNVFERVHMNKYGSQFDDHSYWLNQESEDQPVVVYVHGGGYIAQLTDPQVSAMVALHSLVEKTYSTLVLDYSLTGSGASWPTQQNQLHATYTELVKRGYKRIILFGDSAGGHTVVTYLQHLRRYPHLPVPEKLVAVSPWIKLQALNSDQPVKSYIQNRDRDCLSMDFLQNVSTQKYLIANNSLQSLDVSPGNCAYRASDWIDTTPKDVLVILGEDELMRDDILEWTHYALGSTIWNNPNLGEGDGTYSETTHSWVANTNSSLREVHVDPWGLHDAMFAVEAAKFTPIIGTTKVVDKNTFFALSRVASFLNKTL